MRELLREPRRDQLTNARFLCAGRLAFPEKDENVLKNRAIRTTTCLPPQTHEQFSRFV
ncbi:MAG TPA: hypothetical protein V6C95_08440 [Coleofasciculaceae cyanobacterium]